MCLEGSYDLGGALVEGGSHGPGSENNLEIVMDDSMQLSVEPGLGTTIDTISGAKRVSGPFSS